MVGPYAPAPDAYHSCGGAFYDFSVDPLGAYVLSASHQCAAALATSSSRGTGYFLPTGLDPTAVAWSPDGQYVAVGDSSYDPTGVQVLPRGSTQPAWAWAQGGAAPQGLAFSPDGTKVFAIVGYNGGLGFQVLDRYTPVDTEITSGPDATSYTPKASFSFSSHTVEVTFQCNLDNFGWKSCTSPANYLVDPAPGSHTFSVRSVSGDQIDTTGATQTWTVQPPGASITSGPADGTYAQTATFAFSSHDPNSVFMCQLDGASWLQCYSPKTYTNLGPGSHTFRVKAFDGDVASDADPVGASLTWTIAAGGQELDVTHAGTGNGSVTSNPGGINACITFCQAWYAPTTSVTLTATPGAGAKFIGWTGSCTGTALHCVVSMTTARAVTAKFAKLPSQLLTVKKLGSGIGTVKSSPLGINCGTNCTHKYAAATVVTLTATAKAGSTFASWLGACSGTGSCVVTMSAAKTVKAKFTRSVRRAAPDHATVSGGLAPRRLAADEYRPGRCSFSPALTSRSSSTSTSSSTRSLTPTRSLPPTPRSSCLASASGRARACSARCRGTRRPPGWAASSSRSSRGTGPPDASGAHRARRSRDRDADGAHGRDVHHRDAHRCGGGARDEASLARRLEGACDSRHRRPVARGAGDVPARARLHRGARRRPRRVRGRRARRRRRPLHDGLGRADRPATTGSRPART